MNDIENKERARSSENVTFTNSVRLLLRQKMEKKNTIINACRLRKKFPVVAVLQEPTGQV